MAYRIVSEAVAGARRCGVSAALLTVRHQPDTVEIELVSRTGDDVRVHAVLPAGSTADGSGAVLRSRVQPA